jgi:hypothetical protein
VVAVTVKSKSNMYLDVLAGWSTGSPSQVGIVITVAGTSWADQCGISSSFRLTSGPRLDGYDGSGGGGVGEWRHCAWATVYRTGSARSRRQSEAERLALFVYCVQDVAWQSFRRAILLGRSTRMRLLCICASVHPHQSVSVYTPRACSKGVGQGP